MATNNTNRVTKDISARKQPNMVPQDEVEAREAAHQAYISHMKASHKKQIEDVEAAHEEEITDLKTQMANNENNDAEKQKKAVDAAVTQAHALVGAEVAQLNQQIIQLRNANTQLQHTLDEELAKKKTELRASQAQVARVQSQVVNLKNAHATEVANLRSQLLTGPNSWVQVHFVGKTHKDRTYVLRPSMTFGKAVEELCQVTGRTFADFTWTFKGNEIAYRHMTLEQLGIKDGDQIHFAKPP